jgi:hypothetical protein
MRCPTCAPLRSVSRARLVRPARARARDARPRSAPNVEAAYAIAHSRLTIAMGIALHCATRAPHWAAVNHALGELTGALGWRVRATALSVAPDRAPPHIQRAIESIEQLVAMRAHEPALSGRVQRAREAIAAAREALSATDVRRSA